MRQSSGLALPTVALQLGHRGCRHVRHFNRERNADLFPANVYLRRVFTNRIDIECQPFLIFVDPLWLRFNAQRVLRWIVVETAPLVRGAIEDDGPLVFTRDRVQAVTSGRQLLSVDQNVVSHDELRRLVGAGAPHVTKRNDGAHLSVARFDCRAWPHL